jgi:dipeptidyl aminopeptidase/acylaminoacyl peptidase
MKLRAAAMQRDIRDTALYMEAEELYGTLFRPGSGLISDAAEVSAYGSRAVFAGTLVEELNAVPPTRICSTELTTGDTRVLTFGPHNDRLPKFSPGGAEVAFLSDRHEAGEFQLYLLDPVSGRVRATPRVNGWVEYLHWSPNGERILLGVAGHGADIAGVQGAITSRRRAVDLPSWMPSTEVGDEAWRWRRVWVYELTSNSIRELSVGAINVWEAVWCGNECLAAVGSAGPAEGLWYSARLHLVDARTGNSHVAYAPQDQLGCLAASPSGKYLAIVEAACSDRGFVAGDLQLLELSTGDLQRVDTRCVDVTYAEWRSERNLLVAGHREFETVVGIYDTHIGTFTETWASRELTARGNYATVSGLNEEGECVLVGEGYVRAPEIAVIRGGRYVPLKSFDLGYAEQVKAIESVECVSWKAADGLEIQGWLLRPLGDGPHALIMNVHGGPVWQWHPVWLGRRSVHVLMLLKRGYAIFLPNPRGSSGRGQNFVRHVYGDLGGADAQDLLSGVDALVDRGVADEKRLGVTGLSYGGFMTSWLITLDTRFSAAVSVGPHTNHVTEYLLSNIPEFTRLFLVEEYSSPGRKYFQRSPIMYASKVKTPTLNICGGLDRCTPPEEAMQFHNALLENGTKSALIMYPEEGHGIRKWPAIIDYAARVVAWFQTHIPESTARLTR